MELCSSIWLRRHLEKALGIWIQWMDSVLLQGQQVEFFHDEFFCLVYVKYMVNVIVFRENLVIRCPKKKLGYQVWVQHVEFYETSFSSNALSCDMVSLFYIPVNNYILSVISTMVTVLLTSTCRLHMAEFVAAVCGYSHSIIKSVSASSVLISSLWWNVASKRPYMPVNTHALFHVASKRPYISSCLHTCTFSNLHFSFLLLP